MSLWLLAYQAPFAQALHVGGDVALQRRDDERPFLRGVHESEPTDPANWRWWELPGGTAPYRWTKADAAVELPGIGGGAWLVEVAAASGRPDGAAATGSWQAGATPPFAIAVAPGRRRYRLLAEAGPGSDLRIQLRAAPFAAPGDPRELGFVLHEVRVRQLGGAHAPAWPQLGWLGLCLGLIYGMGRLALAPRGSALLAGGAALVAGYALAFHRTALTSFTPTLALLLLACAGLAGLGAWLTERFPTAWGASDGGGGGWRMRRDRQNRAPPPAATPTPDHGEPVIRYVKFTRALLLLCILGFALRLGGMLHPHTMFSDARFNANNLYEASLGEVLLSAGLPSDAGGGSAPYPPGPYLLLLPAQLIAPAGSDARVLLMQSGVALLDSLLIGMIGLLLLRLGFGAPAALLGAACYLLPVSALESFSIGEYANLGGQAIAMGFVALLIMQNAEAEAEADPDPSAGFDRLSRRRGLSPSQAAPHAPRRIRQAQPAAWPEPVAGRAILLIPLLTMGLLAHSGVTLSLGAFVAAAWALSWARRQGAAALGPWRLGLAAGVAAGVALLIFYSAPDYLTGVLGRLGGEPITRAGRPPLDVLGQTGLAILGMAPPDLRKVPLPIPLGVAAIAGLALIGLDQRPERHGLRLSLGAWWAGMLLSQALLLVADQGVRWSLFLYPALCLSAGPLLAALRRRGRAGRLVVSAAVALIMAQGLIAWVTQLRDYFHL